MLIADMIGYIAAAVGTLLMLPQIIKIWKTKKVRDLAFGMVLLYFLNCLLWLLYGIMISASPVIIANFIALIISIIQLAFKVKYDYASRR